MVRAGLHLERPLQHPKKPVYLAEVVALGGLDGTLREMGAQDVLRIHAIHALLALGIVAALRDETRPVVGQPRVARLAPRAIEAAGRDDFSEVDRLFRVLQRPFEMQPGADDYTLPSTNGAAGNSLSCSS